MRFQRTNFVRWSKTYQWSRPLNFGEGLFLLERCLRGRGNSERNQICFFHQLVRSSEVSQGKNEIFLKRGYGLTGFIGYSYERVFFIKFWAGINKRQENVRCIVKKFFEKFQNGLVIWLFPPATPMGGLFQKFWEIGKHPIKTEGRCLYGEGNQKNRRNFKTRL